MRPGWYNFVILLATAAAWVTWGMALNIHPDQGVSAMAYFFSSLFLALAGTLYFGGYWLQVKIFGRQPPVLGARTATRQALLLTTLVVVALGLQGWRLLTWFNATILVLLLTFLELLLVARGQGPATPTR